MPSTTLLKRDWEKDHVYLVQFPRAGNIPSPSPYSLKVETWLRVADIPYSNINNEFTKMSSRGQIPFIELNGRQHSDSSLIINHLVESFNKQELEDYSASDKSTARAFYSLLEHHLVWTMFYSRSLDISWLATKKGYIDHLSGIKAFAFKNLLLGHLQKKIKAKCNAQGISTLSKEEITEETKKDIDALSTQLGNKAYLFGDSIKTIDVTAFSILVQLLYTPQFTEEIKLHIENNAANLLDYVNRIKDKYWPDWEETTTTLNMDTAWKNRS